MAAPSSLLAAAGVGNSSTAAVPTTEASHQPARRSGTTLSVPADEAGRHVGHHRAERAGRGIGTGHAGEEDHERHRHGDDRGAKRAAN